MKKRKLKRWVKIALLLIFLGLIIAVGHRITTKAVDECIKNGQNPAICEDLKK